MSRPVDFARVKAIALGHLEALLLDWLPGGTYEGVEYVVRNPKRDDRKPGSFSINVKTGVWADFATEKRGGDPVSLYAYLNDLSQSEAARRLGDRFGIERQTDDGAPADAGNPAEQDEMETALDEFVRRGNWDHCYRYRNIARELVAAVVRRDATGDSKKAIRPVRWTGQTWQIGRHKGMLPLYGTEELDGSLDCPVLVVEGENVVEAAREVLPWYVPVTSGSSTSAGVCDWSVLAGREVVVWPDADDAGRRYADVVARRCSEAGATSIRIVDTGGLPTGWDLADPASENLEIEARLGDAPEVSAHDDNVGQPIGELLTEEHTQHVVRWLWPYRIPIGEGMTIIDGDPGSGKSTVMSDLAARISAGLPRPDGSQSVAGGVVFVCSEASASMIARQVKAAGGNLSRILRLAIVGKGKEARPIALPRDLEALREAIHRVDAVLVVLDPFLEVFSGRGSDTYRDGDSRRNLTPVVEMCRELSVALVGIRHPTKLQGQRAIHRGGGSIAWSAASRTAYLIGRDPYDGDTYVMATVKNNLAPKPPAIAYRLEVVQDNADIDPDDPGVCRVEWLGHVDRDAQELVDCLESLSPEQRDVLEAVRDGIETRSEIAEATGRSPSAVSNSLSRLVELGWLSGPKKKKYSVARTLNPPCIVPFGSSDD